MDEEEDLEDEDFWSEFDECFELEDEELIDQCIDEVYEQFDDASEDFEEEESDEESEEESDSGFSRQGDELL